MTLVVGTDFDFMSASYVGTLATNLSLVVINYIQNQLNIILVLTVS